MVMHTKRHSLVLGLVLEASATVWAFNRAVSVGALNRDDVDCARDNLLDNIYMSSLAVDTCDRPIDAGVNNDYAYP